MSKKKKKPLMAMVSSAYFKIYTKNFLTFRKGAIGKSRYACRTYPGDVSVFGWEGDKDAPIAFIDGSYLLRDRKNTLITFGLADIDGKVEWFNKEGWLPCLVSKYRAGGFECTIENFADILDRGDGKFEIAYSRMTLKNISGKTLSIPRVSKLLIPLNKQPHSVKPGETVVLDCAVGADRFGEKYAYPTNSEIASAGGFDEHYEHMKAYWTERMESLAKIDELPDNKLIDAYKAGYVYTMIVKDGYGLHVGENGYDRVFDHDVLGIMASLLTIGDFKYFDEYSKTILKFVQYPDAGWKFSWPYALYLQKTDDRKLVEERFEQIKTNTHKISSDRDSDGIMKRTNAIDSNGHWTIDNWSALFGLCAYKYICDKIENKSESEWAQKEYTDLLSCVEKKLAETSNKYNLDYIPISMDEPNEYGQRSDPHDANWGSMFLFGRWGWDGYLFGAKQGNGMIEKIDGTYAHIFECRKDITDNPYNFGGYPHGFFCSSYNAGYGSTALRGEKYRDSGIKAYQFMIDHAQSGPFSWWEGVGYPEADGGIWASGGSGSGGGSCPHMWGQSTATKVLWDSLIVQKADSTLLIGRGMPAEWIESDKKTVIRDYPLNGGRKIGFSLVSSNDTVTLTLTGDGAGTCEAILDLIGLRGNIESASCEYDSERGVVIIPKGVTQVTVRRKI